MSLWGSCCERCVHVCTSEIGRRPVNHSRGKEKIQHPNEGARVNECDERERRERGVREQNGQRQGS